MGIGGWSAGGWSGLPFCWQQLVVAVRGLTSVVVRYCICLVIGTFIFSVRVYHTPSGKILKYHVPKQVCIVQVLTIRYLRSLS